MLDLSLLGLSRATAERLLGRNELVRILQAAVEFDGSQTPKQLTCQLSRTLKPSKS